MEWVEETAALAGGLVWGSFINVCLDRWGIRFGGNEVRKRFLEDPTVSNELKDHIRSGDLSPLNPVRSFCFACGHQLLWHELIPVISYLFSAGKCRTCGEAYGIRIMWVELSHVAFFPAAVFFLGFTPEAMLICIDFSFLWLLGYSHSCPGLGVVLKTLGVLLLGGNGMFFSGFFL